MGKLDTTAKDYFKNPERIAALFNYYLYDGNSVIKPSSLKEINTNESIVVRENKKKLPLQRTRDLLHEWAIYEDESLKYILLGTELQGKVHFAEPVRTMLYDSIDYATQVNEHHRKAHNDESQIEYLEDGIKLKRTAAEFLSIPKEVKIKPTITVTLLLGEGGWDGPRSLHDMLDIPSEELKQFIPNYKLNLIIPEDIPEEDFAKLGETDLGFLLRVLKHQRKDAAQILYDSKYERVNTEAANVANEIAHLGLKIEIDEKGDANMCKAMRLHDKEQEVLVSIRTTKKYLKDETEIISAVAEDCEVDSEFVKKLMEENPPIQVAAV